MVRGVMVINVWCDYLLLFIFRYVDNTKTTLLKFINNASEKDSQVRICLSMYVT